MDARSDASVQRRPRRRLAERCRPRAVHLGLGALGLACVAGCFGGPPEVTLETRATAEQATRTGDWETAADRWHAVFVSGGYREVGPCVETARAMIALGDPESASSVLNLGLQQNPDDVALLEMRAEALVASGFRRAAERSYERALAGDRDNVRCLHGIAEQRMALGKESQAVRPLERLVELGAADYDVWRLLAQARTAEGDAAGGFVAWCRAFELDREEHGVEGAPVDPERLVDRLTAALLYSDERVSGAHPEAPGTCATWLAEVVRRDPQHTRAHFQLGVLHLREGRADEAVQAYRRAVETDPACLVALTNLALLYSDLGDEEQTRAMVDRALELETDERRREALRRLVEESAEKAAGEQGGSL